MHPRLLKSLRRFEARQCARVRASPPLPFIFLDCIAEQAFMDSGRVSMWQASLAVGRLTADQFRRAEQAGVALLAMVIPNGESQKFSHQEHVAAALDNVTLPTSIFMLMSIERVELNAEMLQRDESGLLVPETTGLKEPSSVAISPLV